MHGGGSRRAFYGRLTANLRSESEPLLKSSIIAEVDERPISQSRDGRPVDLFELRRKRGGESAK